MLTEITNSDKIIPDEAFLTLLFTAISSFSLRSILLQTDTEEEYKLILEFFGGQDSKECYLPQYPSYLAPDICISCLHEENETRGGRVRVGCYKCLSCSEENRLTTIFFTVFSGLSSEEATYYLARILKRRKEKQ